MLKVHKVLLQYGKGPHGPLKKVYWSAGKADLR